MAKYKDIIAFCFLFSISFVFMSQVVKTVDPVLSTLITYGFAALFFILININNLSELTLIAKGNVKVMVKINVSTLVNTFLAFYVMLYVSPIVYIIVFFSGLSFFSVLFKQDRNKLNITSTLSVFTLSIMTSILISDAAIGKTVVGILLTLISTFFALQYMKDSAVLHSNLGVKVSQVLALRFFLVIAICGSYSIYDSAFSTLVSSDLFLLVFISIIGSIIPLFLMQAAIKKLGVSLTAQFTPFTPIICLIFMILVEGTSFTALEIMSICAMTLLLFFQAKLLHRE
ncbi:DMT family transporter [Moritella sp. 5]|uniref:DMT family transporter n=1 Tax=Moritella sp. 5 TaxID=2746231 RepID=UPI001BAD1E78|nr:DMT family transporter [Moritella sp. 5]QUM80339.1 DMT family transporter [Moritella sp. 5]